MKPKSLFKVGEAKLRNGAEAYVFEVSNRIYMKVKDRDGVWMSAVRNLDGRYWNYGYCEEDLLPNNAPEKIVIEGVEFRGYPCFEYMNYDKLQGKRWTLTLEEECQP
jgi:hypothetical protein